MQRIGWGAFAAALLGGCVDGTGTFCRVHGDCAPGLACVNGACEVCEGGGKGVACRAVDLVVRSCEPEADPLAGAKKLRITVSGAGIDPLVREFDPAAKSAQTPAIPFGKDRRVSVEALGADDAPLARGRSTAFDMLRDAPVVAPVVWVRRIGSFSPTQAIDDASSCTRLEAARAGHTSTLLPDGRVLLAGGYAFNALGETVAVPTLEIYDPARGTFRLADHLHDARAGHTATLLADGRVLLAGGVTWKEGVLEPLATAEILDPKENTITLLNMKQARAHHAAALLPDGSVLLAGGVTGTAGVATDTTELFLPAGTFQEGPRLDHPRKDHAIVVHDGAALLIGGHDGTASLASVEVVGTSASSSSDWRLSVAKAHPLAVPFQAAGQDGLFVFGAPDAVPAPIAQLWDYFPWSASASLPARDPEAKALARIDACAAPFDGGAIVVGGRASDGTLLSTTDVFTLGSAGFTAGPAKRDISAPRANASCLTLADGSILVTGGEERSADKPVVSFAAEVYEP